MYNELANFVRENFYKPEGTISLHAPVFIGKEKEYLKDVIDSTFVSSVGEYVNVFENMIKQVSGAKYAIATSNGTASLHTALILAGVTIGDEVLSQALTFVATANAISYCHANPIFIDVDISTLGMSPEKLLTFLNENAEIRDDGFCYNKNTNKCIRACVPMHTFGHPSKIDEISAICNDYNIFLIEDAAEALGSYYKNQHLGTFGEIGTFSFNGNKTITCGGGGAIVTNSEELAIRAKHITTTAKVPHSWDFIHDEIGYNYRMPNLNAALACAQLENLDFFLSNKRELANMYIDFFAKYEIETIKEPLNARSNYWLNAILIDDENEKNVFLKKLNDLGIQCRPIWKLMSDLPMFNGCQTDSLENSIYLEQRIVNLPSGVRLKTL